MPDVVGIAGEIALDDLDAALDQCFTPLEPHRRLAFELIFPQQIAAQLTVIDQHVVKAILADVLLQHAHKILETEAVGLAVLGHDAAHVNNARLRLAQSLAHPFAQKIRNDAGVEVAGADDHKIGVEDRLACPRVEAPAADQEGVADGHVGVVPRHIDFALADDALAVLQRHPQMHIVERHRDHLAAHVEHRAEFLDTALKVAHDVGKRRQEEVADGVAGDALAFLEAILEQPAHHLGVLGQRHDCPTHVAGRKNAELVAQFAGRTAGICRRDDRRKVQIAFPAQPGKDVEGSRSAADGRDVGFAGVHAQPRSSVKRA